MEKDNVMKAVGSVGLLALVIWLIVWLVKRG
jgi:hypothetical protein